MGWGIPNEIRLTTDASSRELTAILSGVSHISQLTVDRTEGSFTTAHIKTDCRSIFDLSRAVFRAFAASDRAILEMTLKKGNLEDVFIELTETAAAETKEEQP